MVSKTPTDPIFPAPERGSIRGTKLNTPVLEAGVEAGRSGSRHWDTFVRHSQVPLLVAQGEHPKVIAERLGHSSVRTVLDVYGHLYEGADEAAAERLDEQIASYARPRRVQGDAVRIPKAKKAQQ